MPMHRTITHLALAALGAAIGVQAVAAQAGMAAAGPFATKAKVTAKGQNGPIQLKREEQIALMFLMDMENLEHSCQLDVQRTCTMQELLTPGLTLNKSRIGNLKFDPNKTDPNYTYTLAVGGESFELHANAKRPGLLGFCIMGHGIGFSVATYSSSGKASFVDPEMGERGVEGDSFVTF